MARGLSTILQPLVDVIVSVSPQFLTQRNLHPGSYAMVDRTTQDELLSATTNPPFIASGGSASNSIACANILGVHCTYTGLVGDDDYGILYQRDFADLGISSPNPRVAHARTGMCLSLVTPDGERTMRTDLAVALELNSTHIDPETIGASEWLLIEGHLLTAGEKNTSAILKGIEVARQKNTKVAVNINSEFAAQTQRELVLREVLPKIDMIIGNEPETMALASESTHHAAFATLSQLCPSVVVTAGRDGALVKHGDQSIHVSAYTEQIKVIDTTGAGDAFTGVLLAGLALGYPIERAAQGAARLAAAVVAQSGARLPASAAPLWRDAVK